MSSMLCDHLGCSNIAIQRCTQCNNGFCVKHIGYKQALICDDCIAANRKAGSSLMKRGRNILLIGILLSVLSFLVASLIVRVAWLFLPLMFIGSALFWIGLIVCIVGAVRSSKRA